VMTIEIIVRYIACKKSDHRVERLGAKQLQGVLPLVCCHELRVSDDLNSQRLERLIEFAKTLVPASCHQPVKLVRGAGIARELVDIVVKGLGVLYRVGEGVVLIV
jgi:hypothetical protein